MPLQFSRQPPTVLCKQALSCTVAQRKDAWALLHKLTKEDIKGNSSILTASLDARSLLREAVEVIATNAAPAEGWDPSIQPPEILLGVLSSDIRLAVRALRDWASALHVPFVIPTSRVEGVSVTSLRGSVYIKYNAVSQQCYATQYSGTDRGVLVTFGGSLVGHLPLGLFDESMQQAPPSLS
ncbi:hypothetical protein WJX82_006991 [Trebouxia sp. C0006]